MPRANRVTGAVSVANLPAQGNVILDEPHPLTVFQVGKMTTSAGRILKAVPADRVMIIDIPSLNT